MLNTTKTKSRRIIVEKVDCRIDPRIKREFFRISIDGEMGLEVSPDEFFHLGKIAKSYRKAKKRDVQELA